MRRIAKGQQPQGLQVYRSQGGGYPITGDASLARSIRQALLAVQHGECAYCCGKLDTRDTRIEHFHPQSRHVANEACATESGVQVGGDSRVAWTNLLLCCDGDETNKCLSHCDVSKSASDVCKQFLNPSRIASPRDLLVGMRSDGYLVARPSVFPDVVAAQAVLDEILNLNSDHMSRRRALQVGPLWAEYLQLAKHKRSRRVARKLVLVRFAQQRPSFIQAVFLDWIDRGAPHP